MGSTRRGDRWLTSVASPLGLSLYRSVYDALVDDASTGSRDRLLRAGLAEFSQRGYAGASLAPICAAAGVTKPTLYHFFGSKAGLFAALAKEMGEPLSAQVLAASVYDGDVKRSLTRLAETHFEVATSAQEFHRMLLLVWWGPREPETQPAIDLMVAWYRAAVGVFLGAERDHGNMVGRAHLYAASFRGLLDTYVSLGWSGAVDLADPAVTRAAVHQFMHGIFS